MFFRGAGCGGLTFFRRMFVPLDLGRLNWRSGAIQPNFNSLISTNHKS